MAVATQYETFGPCVPQVGTGAANALEVLGLATAGGNIQIQYFTREIKTDGGGEAPAEMQYMGAVALIDFDLPVKDKAVLAKLRKRTEAASADGLGGTPGTLLGTGGFLFSLYLPSSTTDPWFFSNCKLESYGGRFGTENTEDKLRFKAIRYLAGLNAGVTGPVTAAGVELYRRTP